jgi:hypothetical protein
MTKQQELAVRKSAARHLKGIPARQNAASIDLLETQIYLEKLEAEIGADELARWEALEGSVYG